MSKIKAFLAGFDYAVKHHNTIEDHHFQSYPGARWHDKDTQKLYRKSISIGRKYMQYRYEIIAWTVMMFTLLVFIFTW